VCAIEYYANYGEKFFFKKVTTCLTQEKHQNNNKIPKAKNELKLE